MGDDGKFTSVKLLLIGDSGVGKTAIMLQFSENTFSETFITTVGIDYKYKFVSLTNKETNKEEKIRLEIWDTAGQERFKAITRSYLRGAEGLLLVYDITDEITFENVKTWMQQIQQFAEKDCDKVLVGNKCDLNSARKVEMQEGQSMADKFGVQFFEASARSNLNIQEAFTCLAEQVLARKTRAAPKDDPSAGGVNLNGGSQGKKGGCC